MTSKLFVVGFPRDMGEITLLEMFSVHGQVAALNIVKDKESGFSLGYGFVEMTDEAGALRAIAALNGLVIDDRTISVRNADKRPAFEITGRPSTIDERQMKPVITKKKRPRRQV